MVGGQGWHQVGAGLGGLPCTHCPVLVGEVGYDGAQGACQHTCHTFLSVSHPGDLRQHTQWNSQMTSHAHGVSPRKPHCIQTQELAPTSAMLAVLST